MVVTVALVMAAMVVAAAVPAFVARGSGGPIEDTSYIGADVQGGGGGSDRGSGSGGHISGNFAIPLLIPVNGGFGGGGNEHGGGGGYITIISERDCGSFPPIITPGN